MDNPYLGKTIKSIESNWVGVVQSVDIIDDEEMLNCLGKNAWTNTLDTDDRQWFSLQDVRFVKNAQGNFGL